VREVIAEVGSRDVKLSRLDAKEWIRHGFARWIGRNRIRISARFNPRGDLRGFSAIVGEVIAKAVGDDWAVTFKRDQFPRRKR
jgi:hypothetical protein